MQTINLNQIQFENTNQTNEVPIPPKSSFSQKLKNKIRRFRSGISKMSFSKRLFLAIFGLLLTSGMAVSIIYFFVIATTPNHVPLETQFVLLETKAIPKITNQLAIPTPPEIKNIPSVTNGILLSNSEYKEIENLKPLVIMVENYPDARPQSGLEQADIVYEALAESGITRFMTVFWTKGSEEVGPVRSARTYYLDWASEYDNPSIMNIGQAGYDEGEEVVVPAADARAYIIQYGIHSFIWYGRNVFWRDQEKISQGIGIEHTAYTSTQMLWEDADKMGWNSKPNIEELSFKKDASLDDRALTSEATIKFMNLGGDNYKVRWVYDRANNGYKRFMANTEHIEKTTGKQLTAKNVIIQEHQYSETHDKNGRILFTTIGSGKATVLRDGKVIEATWQKDSRTSRTKYFDSVGNEIQLNRGKIWIEIAAKIGDNMISEVSVQ